MKPLTYFDLVAALKYRTVIKIASGNLVTLSSIEAEDGSGLSWNIRVYVHGGTTTKMETIYWRETGEPRFFFCE